MKISPVCGNTYALEGHGLMGLYQLDDRRCILIDSGDITERGELLDTLDQAHLTPVGVMSTHVHIDHSINNAALRARYHCPVAVPAGEVETCRTPLGMKGYFYTYTPQMLEHFYGEMLCEVDAPIPYRTGCSGFAACPSTSSTPPATPWTTSASPPRTGCAAWGTRCFPMTTCT